jgi:hypothetical protein
MRGRLADVDPFGADKRGHATGTDTDGTVRRSTARDDHVETPEQHVTIDGKRVRQSERAHAAHRMTSDSSSLLGSHHSGFASENGFHFLVIEVGMSGRHQENGAITDFERQRFGDLRRLDVPGGRQRMVSLPRSSSTTSMSLACCAKKARTDSMLMNCVLQCSIETAPPTRAGIKPSRRLQR